MLRFKYQMVPRKLKRSFGPCSGPAERVKRLRMLVTALVRHERIETTWAVCDETRGYAERLIDLAIRNGDTHKETMEMADYWLLEKDLVHKLFKVLAPRYKQYSTSFTAMHRLPTEYPGKGFPRAVLELNGNPWPPVLPKRRENKYYLTNLLLEAARNDYRLNKQAPQPENESLVSSKSEETIVQEELNTASEKLMDDMQKLNMEETSNSDIHENKELFNPSLKQEHELSKSTKT